jgi:hypothetical protein
MVSFRTREDRRSLLLTNPGPLLGREKYVINTRPVIMKKYFIILLFPVAWLTLLLFAFHLTSLIKF